MGEKTAAQEAAPERNRAYTVSCKGPGGRGHAYLIVVARPVTVRATVMKYLATKVNWELQCINPTQLKVTAHEDSDFASERVSCADSGVLLEYNCPAFWEADSHLKRLVYVAAHLQMADQLDELQSVANNGRGVSCVRTVITYLRRGDFDSAKAVIETEHDKIENYPEIVQVLEERGLWHRIEWGKGIWA
jgi:hypothetical protein